ncbi:MAG: lipid-A-disaccharide synthase N-terminal domain-containing protein [Alphaproteobacteria bacterium]
MIAQAAAAVAEQWAKTSTSDLIWHGIGLVGQCMFFMRFVVQWFASEKQKRSVVPEAFWYWSIAGGTIVLIYSIHLLNPVFILAQGTGLTIYSRNLYFIWRNKRQPGQSPETQAENSEAAKPVQSAEYKQAAE